MYLKRNINSIIERIQRVYGVQQDIELKKVANINPNTLSNWKDRNSIPYKKLDEISQNEGVSYDWLLTGKGNMFLQENKKNHKEVVKKEPSNELINIPYFSETYASAGGGAINYEDAPTAMAFNVDFLRAHLGIRSFKNLHIINAVGNSMEPLIQSGELLFISPIENDDNAVMSGGIYVVRYYDDVFVKRLNREPKTKEVELISINNEVKPMYIIGEDLENLQIIGRVVGHFDRI